MSSISEQVTPQAREADVKYIRVFKVLAHELAPNFFREVTDGELRDVPLPAGVFSSIPFCLDLLGVWTNYFFQAAGCLLSEPV
jgi:hypothetical protein